MLNERIEDNIVIAEFANGKNNTITRETLEQIRKMVKEVNTNDSLKGIVMTGAGKTFSAGFDLPMFLSFKDMPEVIEFFNMAEEVLTEFFMCRKPVVCAINGAAVAGGLIFAMAADYRIIKNHPKIKTGMTEIKIGLGLSIAQCEIMRFGFDSNIKFRNIMFNGRLYDVNEALSLGIADEIAEEAELLDKAKKTVLGWIDNPGRAFMMLKEGYRRPHADRIYSRLKKENWQDGFKIFFDKGTRGALELVSKMMG
jgi:enoyl-CoA hydratase/carnithine racemase